VNVPFFSVRVESGVVIIDPGSVPLKRDPDGTLWRTSTSWGIVNRSFWSLSHVRHKYWVQSEFVACYQVNCKWDPDPRFVLYPRKWVDTFPSVLGKYGAGAQFRLSDQVKWKPPPIPDFGWVEIESVNRTALRCAACTRSLELTLFSSSQLKKGAMRRCRSCVG